MSVRIPFVSRRGRDKGLSVSVPDMETPSGTVPWWVSVFTDVGRPMAAIVVLILCAPGEQHLARLAGWGHTLSWGMAGLFSMYAGIAAVVATVRPKGAPGKNSAVWGAVVSLLLAMGAQPVSHLFVTGWLSAEPRAPWILVAVVSCVPPFILGHLLHLAASPSGRTGQSTGQTQVTVSRAPSRTAGDTVRRTVPDKAPEPALPAPVSRPAVSLDKTVRPELSAGQEADTVSLADKRNMSARALVLAQRGQDTDTIKDTLRKEFPDAKADSVRKAAGRAVDKVSAAS